jgi:small GTP-binding protein
MEEESDPLKVLLIGSHGVGKSTLLRTLVLNQSLDIDRPLSPTVGLDIKPYSFHIDKYKIYSRIWDIGGDERYQKLANPHFAWTHAFFIVFALDDPESLRMAQSHASLIHPMAHTQACLALIGNKSDAREKVSFACDSY